MNKAIILLILSLLILIGCGERDAFVGLVVEINDISLGDSYMNGVALVTLNNGRQLVVSEYVTYLEIGSEVWTTKSYGKAYKIRRFDDWSQWNYEKR